MKQPAKIIGAGLEIVKDDHNEPSAVGLLVFETDRGVVELLINQGGVNVLRDAIGKFPMRRSN